MFEELGLVDLGGAVLGLDLGELAHEVGYWGLDFGVCFISDLITGDGLGIFEIITFRSFVIELLNVVVTVFEDKFSCRHLSIFIDFLCRVFFKEFFLSWSQYPFRGTHISIDH